MTIEPRQRSPLGAFFRSPLGAFGPGAAAPVGQLYERQVTVQSITSGNWLLQSPTLCSTVTPAWQRLGAGAGDELLLRLRLRTALSGPDQWRAPQCTLGPNGFPDTYATFFNGTRWRGDVSGAEIVLGGTAQVCCIDSANPTVMTTVRYHPNYQGADRHWYRGGIDIPQNQLGDDGYLWATGPNPGFQLGESCSYVSGGAAPLRLIVNQFLTGGTANLNAPSSSPCQANASYDTGTPGPDVHLRLVLERWDGLAYAPVPAEDYAALFEGKTYRGDVSGELITFGGDLFCSSASTRIYDAPTYGDRHEYNDTLGWDRYWWANASPAWSLGETLSEV